MHRTSGWFFEGWHQVHLSGSISGSSSDSSFDFSHYTCNLQIAGWSFYSSFRSLLSWDDRFFSGKSNHSNVINANTHTLVNRYIFSFTLSQSEQQQQWPQKRGYDVIARLLLKDVRMKEQDHTKSLFTSICCFQWWSRKNVREHYKTRQQSISSSPE